jgi:ABC-type polysaccharide/polyol phosphate export permease
VLKDLKLKYRGSTLGFVWSLANPLLMLLVYSLAFTYIMGVRKPAFVYFLLIGLLPWTFFAQSMGMATTSVTDGAGLLRSVRFPRAALPLSTVLFNLLQYLMTFGVLLPVMMLTFAIRPAAAMLAYPLVLLLLVLFVTGVALMVATSATIFRDVKHFVEVALGVLFWTTPIIYDLQDAPEALRLPILLSPMSPFVTALHDIFYTGAWPSAPTWVAALAWTTAAFVGGVTVFLSFEDRLVEHV